MYGIAVAVLILIILVKILNVNNIPQQSLFHSANAKFIEQILKNAPKLTEPYTPTRLWGYSGHVQTIIGGVISFFRSPLLNGKRFAFKVSDGATVTYDLYQPLDKQQNNDDITLALAPGICNSSESVYIRRVVYHAQFSGYRVAVLNHVGALKCVPVTSPRIFHFGNTSDYDGMVRHVVTRYPTTKIVCIGFSMGGNIVTKYLGERKSMPQIIAGISACQV
jgi:abhydrolase domain-containing protein 2